MTKEIHCDECNREYLGDETEQEPWIEIIGRTEDLHSKRLALYCPRCGKAIIEEYKRLGYWIIEN
jgi:hypothetical protein